MQNEHEYYMREAIKESAEAVRLGSYPYGAILVHDKKIILRGHNRVLIDHDITSHAELNVVRQASQQFPPEILLKSTLYTSTESCAMCAGSIYWAGIPRVVFGCRTKVDGRISDEAFAIPNRDIFSDGGHPVELIGPILEEEAIAVLKPYWEKFLASQKPKMGTTG